MMLTFLRIAMVAAPLAVLIAVIGASPAQAATPVSLYLMPSPDDPTSSGYVRLGCGWHMDCSYPEPDDPMYGALDLWKNPCCDYDGEPVTWRVKGNWLDRQAATVVGNVYRTAGWAGDGCDYVIAEMKKLDGTFLARAIYTHVRPASIGYGRPIWAYSAGFKNSSVWGWMAYDEYLCPWDGYHVHQDVQINVGVMTNWARGPYPYKADCYGCGSLWNLWTAYQVWFAYWR